jgi:hypothetical protein
MGEGVIPSRIEGETPKAYRAFVDYCEMGGGRSLRKLLSLYSAQKVAGTYPRIPSTRLPTLKRWSSQNNWQNRVAEYERRAAEAREQYRQQKRLEIEQAVLDDAAEMRRWWAERWGMYQETANAVSTYEVRQLTHMRSDIDDLERRSAGLPHRATESTFKGTGDDGAILVQYVDDWRPPTEDPE